VTARATVAATVLAAAIAAGAAAAPASSPLDARRLALTTGDLPTGATRISQQENRTAALPGGRGHAYTTTFAFNTGRRTVNLNVIVVAAPSVATARAVWAEATAEARRLSAATIRLRALGDQQLAVLHGRAALDELAGVVWVRKRTVVWQVQVSSVRNPFGFSQAEAVSALMRYALAQRRRVGAG
jgi:hypothetical protein